MEVIATMIFEILFIGFLRLMTGVDGLIAATEATLGRARTLNAHHKSQREEWYREGLDDWPLSFLG